MSKQNIADFWVNKEFYKTKEELKQYAREFYTEDFISNYDKWVGNIKDLNEMMYRHLSKSDFDLKIWEEMPFDYFCKNINQLIEDWIETKGDITPFDITTITQKLIQDYTKIQYDNIMKQRNSISSIMNSIKKIVIL